MNAPNRQIAPQKQLRSFGETQGRSLRSGIGSVVPAHGFTHAVSPTACRFPPPMPDRSVTGTSPPTGKKQFITTHPLCAVRMNRTFNGMSAVCASRLFAPCHPCDSILTRQPPPGICLYESRARRIFHRKKYNLIEPFWCIAKLCRYPIPPFRAGAPTMFMINWTICWCGIPNFLMRRPDPLCI